MEDLNIELYEKNVHTYLTKMQDMRNEIDSLPKDWIKYEKKRFLTLTFKKLGTTAGDFLTDVKRQRSKWVNKPSDFNTITFIAGMINFYTNYKSTGERDKQDASKNKFLIAFAKALKQEHSKNKKIPGNPTSSETKTYATEPGNSTIQSAWKFENVGKTATCPDTRAK